MELTPDQKGSLAELAVAREAAKLGLCVLKPLNDGARYDLVLDVGQLLRVQCKWAVQSGDVVQIRCRTCRRSRDGFVRTSYTAEEVDAIAGYCAANDRCYLLPIAKFSGRTMVLLRLAPTRNHQEKGIHWARDYEFAATLRRLKGP